MRPVIEVLSIEDNPADIGLLNEWFTEHLPNCSLISVRDGLEALDYLYRRNQFGQVNTPDLILLDLNIPKIDGRDLIREIKSTPDLSQIPVLVLSTSNSARDVADAYDLGANAFISKPLDLDDLDAMLTSLGDFWFTTARLPRRR